MAETARRGLPATAMPVIVDADTGYGNALSAIRTARRLHAAGAAGLFLEDQVWPKKCGHFAGKRVVPADEWLAKLRAVVDLAREGIDLFVVARTDARAAVSLDDALARARAATQIGVDAIFVEAPQSVEELAGHRRRHARRGPRRKHGRGRTHAAADARASCTSSASISSSRR